MFVGHLGVGLALKKAEPTVNVGALLLAALLLDLLLGLFVLLGLEQIHAPARYAELHYLTFTFPYSHSLAAALAWSAVAYAVTRWWGGRAGPPRRAAVVGLAVLAHYPGDVVEHVRELPLLGPGSYQLGLGLWNALPLALALEALLAALGLALYLRTLGPHRRRARYGMIALMAIMTGLTLTQGLATTPPPATGAAVGWVLEPLVIAAVAVWLDRPARVPATEPQTPRSAV